MTRRSPPPPAARRPPSAAAATTTARPVGRPAESPPRGLWLSRAALGFALAVVVARLFMTESLRSAIPVAAGSLAIPYGPGPATGLVLDMLAGLCPLLVLARRCVDPTFALRRAWSTLAFLALAGWAVVSTAWAGDRYAALVSSCHLLAAGGVMWAVAQIVRGPAHARLLAGACAGLLGVLLAHGLWYQLVDRHDLQHAWETSRDDLLKARNIRPGTFEYIQFENKILHGELMGFSASPNTYAAAIVLLSLVSLGTAVQSIRDRRWLAAAVLLALLAVAAGVLPLAQSRTGDITAAVGVWVVLAAAIVGGVFRRRATLLYAAGVVGVLAAVAFVVGYGLSRGTLFHDSLNFRWRYWVGSFHLWRLHPLLGVGWENFGPTYLGVRLPEATEEIKDPHDYLVRFFAELGAIGGLLALVWTARAWWEVTRPAPGPVPAAAPGGFEVALAGGGRPGPPSATEAERTQSSVAALAAGDDRSVPWSLVGGAVLAVVVGFAMNVVGSVDFAQPSDYALLEVTRRGIYVIVFLALAAAVWLAPARTDRGWTATFAAAPAPLVGAGIVVGLGMFFVHNLIDFAMFETGPTFLFALLLGSAVGLKAPPAAPHPAGAGGRHRLLHGAVALTGAAWLVGLVLVAVPVVSAEQTARDADDALRGGRPAVAARQYEQAFRDAPAADGDYALRAARAWASAGDIPRARAAADRAVAADPADAGTRLTRADLALADLPADRAKALADYQAAVALDPNNLAARRQYAALLEQAGSPRQAATELKAVLELNDRLTQEERKRLPASEVFEIRKQIVRLGG